MKILFDQGTPAPLRRHLFEHSVDTTFEMGWSNVRNGELLDLAEQGVYEILITTDQQLRNQQNLSDRQIAVLALLSTSWPRIKLRTDEIRKVVEGIRPREYREMSIWYGTTRDSHIQSCRRQRRWYSL